MRTRRRLLLWAPVVLLLAFEFFLSSRTPSGMPSLGPWFDGKDKLEHATYFFLTGILAVRAARFGEGWGLAKTAVFLLLGAALWGCSDEIHQSFVPGRSVEIGDVLADVAGVGLAAAAGEWILRTSGLERRA
ncbi:MAG TPA: VanZ family protein [Thermoanaerobaculia bacterium]|jgi:VanZ family protein